MNSPICLFVYKRRKHTELTVSSLLKNQEAADSTLHIFSDGPRSEKDTAAVEEVRAYLKGIKGFKSIHFHFQDNNLGLAKSIIHGVTTILKDAASVIVLEDDMITSPYFLKYMNEGLLKYKDNPQVASIHGYIYPTNQKLPESFFLRGADCWGWATWQRAWKDFEADGHKLLQELSAQNLTFSFDFNGSYPYTEMLRQQNLGGVDSWAIRWYASMFLKNRFTLYPGRSLVQNIGLDGSGTHGDDVDTHTSSVSMTPIELTDIPIEDSLLARQAFIDFFKSQKPGIFKRLSKKIKKWLSV